MGNIEQGNVKYQSLRWVAPESQDPTTDSPWSVWNSYRKYTNLK